MTRRWGAGVTAKHCGAVGPDQNGRLIPEFGTADERVGGSDALIGAAADFALEHDAGLVVGLAESGSAALAAILARDYVPIAVVIVSAMVSNWKRA